MALTNSVNGSASVDVVPPTPSPTAQDIQTFERALAAQLPSEPVNVSGPLLTPTINPAVFSGPGQFYKDPILGISIAFPVYAPADGITVDPDGTVVTTFDGIPLDIAKFNAAHSGAAANQELLDIAAGQFARFSAGFGKLQDELRTEADNMTKALGVFTPSEQAQARQTLVELKYATLFLDRTAGFLKSGAYAGLGLTQRQVLLSSINTVIQQDIPRLFARANNQILAGNTSAIQTNVGAWNNAAGLASVLRVGGSLATTILAGSVAGPQGGAAAGATYSVATNLLVRGLSGLEGVSQSDVNAVVPNPVVEGALFFLPGPGEGASLARVLGQNALYGAGTTVANSYANDGKAPSPGNIAWGAATGAGLGAIFHYAGPPIVEAVNGARPSTTEAGVNLSADPVPTLDLHLNPLTGKYEIGLHSTASAADGQTGNAIIPTGNGGETAGTVTAPTPLGSRLNTLAEGTSVSATISRLAKAKSPQELAEILHALPPEALGNSDVIEATFRRAADLNLWFRGVGGDAKSIPDSVFTTGLSSKPNNNFPVDSAIYLSTDPSVAFKYSSARLFRSPEAGSYIYTVIPFSGEVGKGPYSFNLNKLYSDLGFEVPAFTWGGLDLGPDILFRMPVEQAMQIIDSQYDLSSISKFNFTHLPPSSYDALMGIVGGAIYEDSEVRVLSHIFPDEILFGVERTPTGNRLILNPNFKPNANGSTPAAPSSPPPPSPPPAPHSSNNIDGVPVGSGINAAGQPVASSVIGTSSATSSPLNLNATPAYTTTAPGRPFGTGQIRQRFPELFNQTSVIDPNSVAGVYNTALTAALDSGKTQGEASAAGSKAVFSLPQNVIAYAGGYAGGMIDTLPGGGALSSAQRDIITKSLATSLDGKDPDTFTATANKYFESLKTELAHGATIDAATAKSAGDGAATVAVSTQTETALGSSTIGDAPNSAGLLTLKPDKPADLQVAEGLGNAATFLNWIGGVASKIDPAVGAEINKAVNLATTASEFIRAFSGNPKVASGKLDAAALALFNLAATFSPEIAKIAPYVNTGKQAADVITGLTSGTLTGAAAGTNVSSLASSLSGLVHAPQALTDALQAASLVFKGFSLFGAGAVAGAVPVAGWVFSIGMFVFGLLHRNDEHWTKYKTILSNVSVDGGQNPITGQVLQDDTVDQKTSDKSRNRVRYTGQASEAPVFDARFTLKPETVMQNSPNAKYTIVSSTTAGVRGTPPTMTIRDNTTHEIYSMVYREIGGRGPTQMAWVSDGEYGSSLTLTDAQTKALQQVAVQTGNYVLDLAVGFHAINPDVKPVQKTQTLVISADQATKLRADFGGDTGYAPFTDARIQDFRPWINQMGTVTWETDHTTPNVYTYDDFNGDGVPDMMRQGILQKLWVSADGKFEVTINSSINTSQFSCTANSQAEAYAVGARSNVLMVYLASHPELYDLYFSQPQANASGNIALIYEWAQTNGVLPKLDQLITLAGPVLGTTAAEQLQNMSERGQQIAQLKKELGITVDPFMLDANPDLAAAFNHNTLPLLNHYIAHGNAEGRAVNDAGLVLPKWQPQSTGWSELQALDYIASYPDLMNGLGTNAEAGKAHWNANGRWEQRATTFNIDTYLASRPDVRAAAVAALTKPGNVVIHAGGVHGTPGYIDVPQPNEYGPARLYAQGTDDNTGEVIWAGSNANETRISYTQSQINALATPVPPSEGDIRLFAVKHYITTGRFEGAVMPNTPFQAAQALIAAAPAVQPVTTVP